MKWWILIVTFVIIAVIDSQDLDPAEPVPEKCTSYNISGNGTILYKKSFLCTSSDNPYCCGEEGHQYCCSSRSHDIIFFVIFGVIAGLSVLAFIGFCVRRHMRSTWLSNGTSLRRNPPYSAKDTVIPWVRKKASFCHFQWTTMQFKRDTTSY